MNKNELQERIKKGIEKYGIPSTRPYESIWLRKKWFREDDCNEKKDRRNRVSPVFWDIPTHLYGNKLWRSQCIELTEQSELPLFKGDKTYVLSSLDIHRLSKEHNVTIDNVRKQIDKWCSGGGPFIKLGMNEPKNRNGCMIYGIGYWKKTDNPMYEYRFVHFLKQTKPIERWRKGILYRSKRKN